MWNLLAWLFWHVINVPFLEISCWIIFKRRDIYLTKETFLSCEKYWIGLWFFSFSLFVGGKNSKLCMKVREGSNFSSALHNLLFLGRMSVTFSPPSPRYSSKKTLLLAGWNPAFWSHCLKYSLWAFKETATTICSVLTLLFMVDLKVWQPFNAKIKDYTNNIPIPSIGIILL